MKVKMVTKKRMKGYEVEELRKVLNGSSVVIHNTVLRTVIEYECTMDTFRTLKDVTFSYIKSGFLKSVTFAISNDEKPEYVKMIRELDERMVEGL